LLKDKNRFGGGTMAEEGEGEETGEEEGEEGEESTEG